MDLNERVVPIKGAMGLYECVVCASDDDSAGYKTTAHRVWPSTTGCQWQPHRQPMTNLYIAVAKAKVPH